MFSIITPIMKVVARGGIKNIVGAAKENIILWIVAGVASLFALLFLNIAIYLLIAINYDVLHAAIILCLLWVVIFFGAVIWAKSIYKNIAKDHSAKIAEVVNKQRDILIPVVMTLLPILRRKKQIVKIAGGLITMATITSIIKSFCKK